MAKAVEEIEGGLADSVAGEQALQQVVAEQEDELEGIERRDRCKVTVGRPDAPAGESVEVRMEIEVVTVALNRDDDARKGGWIRGNLLEDLTEGLPGRLAEQAESLWGGI